MAALQLMKTLLNGPGAIQSQYLMSMLKFSLYFSHQRTVPSGPASFSFCQSGIVALMCVRVE